MQKPRGDVKAGGAKPDIWFEPKVVWEVLTADLSLSPIYTAAQGLVGGRISRRVTVAQVEAARLMKGVFHCASPASFGRETTNRPTTLQVQNK